MPRSLPKRTYFAVLTRYDLRRDPVDHSLDPIAPEDPGEVHAFGSWMPLPREKSPSILTHAEALCGERVKLQLPVEFDPGDPDACQRCAGAVIERRQNWPAARRATIRGI